MHLFETRSLSFSILLHAAAAVIAFVGLPMLLPKPPEPAPLVMTVEILPIAAMTNVKPSDQSIQEAKDAPTPKITKPVPPTMTEKPKEPAPKVKTPEPEKKPFDPMEGAEEKPEDKTKEKPKPKNDDFAALLSKLKQEDNPAPKKDAKDTTTTAENKTKSDAPYDASLPLSLSEKDMIRGQFIPCWNMPAGAKDAHTLAARVKITLQADGTVLSASLAADQQSRYNSDSFFRAAADSALRAVHKCSPLKNLPPDKYNTWREMELNFDPAEL